MKQELEMALSAVKQILRNNAVILSGEEGDEGKAVIENDFDNIAIEIVNFISLNFSVMPSLQQGDEMCFHECPNCNIRCNCSDQPCSCCNEA